MAQQNGLPDCLLQQPPQCREIRINAKVPLDWALPLYGFLMPLIVAVTVLTNSFIVVVLSQRALRTPTNFVLGSMAVSELLTALVCLPWLLYYYTLHGFETDEQQGLPQFWCWLFPYLATILPSMFHTSAIWLTVYLAVQRFIYICMPKMVRSHMRRSKQIVVCIFMASVWIYAPELFANYNQSFSVFDPRTNRTRNVCVISHTALIHKVGNNLYHLLLYGVHTLLVHTLPCVLLVFFTWKLLSAIREADKKHALLFGRTPQQRRYSSSGIAPDAGHSGTFVGRCSIDDSGSSAGTLPLNATNSTTTTYKWQQSPPPAPRASISDTKRVHGLRQNTRMLLAVILLFLLTEIPAALIFSVHVGSVVFKLTFIINHYATLNKLLIVRNVLIVISYPLRFAIYCGMSAQFREVVQQMLSSKRRKLLLLVLHSPYGKLQHFKEMQSKSIDATTLTTEKCAATVHDSSVLWKERQGKGAARGARVDTISTEAKSTATILEPVTTTSELLLPVTTTTTTQNNEDRSISNCLIDERYQQQQMKRSCDGSNNFAASLPFLAGNVESGGGEEEEEEDDDDEGGECRL